MSDDRVAAFNGLKRRAVACGARLAYRLIATAGK
jgi:hypothetical protein